MLPRMTKIALATAAALLLSTAGFAQNGRWWRGDGDHDRDDGYRQNAYYGGDRDDNRWYRDGLRDGREDAERGRGMRMRREIRDRDDRQAYAAGYRDGYNGAYNRNPNRGVYGNNYPNGGYGYPNPNRYPNGYPNGGYGQYGNQAYNVGYQDGLRHGQSDRATGHSYRPQHDDDWRNADRGYNGSMGSKQAYKDQYRSGYQAGYDRGYRY